ncbi:Anosmin-1 [Trichinella pseudospiralis]
MGKNPQSEHHSAVAFLVGQLGEGQSIRAQPLGSPNVRLPAEQFVNVCQQRVLIENPQISKKKVGCPPACPVAGRCRWTVIDHQLNNGQGANSGRPLSRLSDQLPPFHRLLSARFGQVGTDKSASGQVCVKRKSPARFSFS